MLLLCCMNNTDALEDKTQSVNINPHSGGGVGLGPKEKESSNSAQEIQGIPVNSLEQALELQGDVKKADVGVVDQDKVSFTEEHARTGMQPAGKSMPVSAQPSGFAQFPMTESEARKHLKTGKPDDSKTWESTVVVRETGKRKHIKYDKS